MIYAATVEKPQKTLLLFRRPFGEGLAYARVGSVDQHEFACFRIFELGKTAIDKDTTVTYGDGSVEYVDNSADFAQDIVDVSPAEPVDEPRDGGTGRQVSMNDL